MGAEENKAVMREFLEASASDNVARIRDLLAPDFIAHLAAGPVGPDAFVEHNSVTGDAFSEKVFSIKDQIAEGDRVAARTVWQGTHSRSNPRRQDRRALVTIRPDGHDATTWGRRGNVAYQVAEALQRCLQTQVNAPLLSR